MTDNSALRRECEKYGCARRYLDPKLERYSECFPGKISMGDIDGSVEVNGCILWVEWKHGAVLERFEEMHCAQWLQAVAFTRNSDRQTFVFVVGPISEPEKWMWRRVRRGTWLGQWETSGEEGLMTMFRNWATWAKQQERAA